MQHAHEDKPAPFVQWEFERDNHYLTCGVSMSPTASSCEVSVVPLWAGGKIAVETYRGLQAALQRHAAIAADLRTAGWTVAAYTA
jgi:hypothetical protein